VAIWYRLWPFGIFYGYSIYFFPFWYVVQRKIWQPCAKGQCKRKCFENFKNQLKNRTARFGDFLPIRRLITLGSFIENYRRAQILGPFFPMGEVEFGYATFWAIDYFGQFNENALLFPPI
jgi:hypothetical protein